MNQNAIMFNSQKKESPKNTFCIFFSFILILFYIDLPPYLNKTKYIFLFIFLSAMIFTVVTYLPLIEEEVAHKKMEFSKKTLGDESSGGADDETESDNEDDTIFNLVINYTPFNLLANECFYIHSFHDYFYLLDDTSTPPPKA
jgi:hypothetical protein